MTSRQTEVVLSPANGVRDYDPARNWSDKPDAYGPSVGPKIAGFGRALLRRGKLVLLTIIVLNVVAYYGVRTLPPRYTASADLIVSPREEQVVDLKAVLSGLSGTSDVIESEIQVLRSREVARSVVQKLNLDQSSEFDPSMQEPGLRQHVTSTALDVLAWARGAMSPGFGAIGLGRLLTGTQSETPAAPVRTESGPISLDPLSAPVDRFLNQLDIGSKGRSRVITISFTSTDPSIAAKVPNAVADAYIANQLSAKTNATAQATKWLNERVAELRAQLLNADEAVEAYRRKAGIVPIRDSTLLNQQITEASQQVMHAHEQVAELKGRADAVDPLDRLHPKSVDLVRDLAAARAREQTLQVNLANMRKQGDAGSQSEIGLRALQREADADRNLYDRLDARARETNIQSGLLQADATVISRAERPEEPSFPKLGVIMPLFFAASVMVAVLLVLWLESLDRGFSTAEQLQAMLGVPTVGAIPLVKRRRIGRGSLDTYCVKNPRSPFSEAIRSLHTSLMLSSRDGVPKTVLIASALPGEGKSSVAVGIASLMASCGKRVVVVDCDLRKPTVHKSFNLSRSPGLTDCLDGKATLDAIIQQDPASLAFVISSGTKAITAPDVFASTAMSTVLRKLGSTFDLVILDGGPVLGISDTRHLCRLADKTVFVVRWQDTRCATAWLGLRQLNDDGADVAGTLLTMINPKHYQKYSPVSGYRQRMALYINA